VTTTTYTQPPGWLHGEGTGVPFEKPIEVEIRWDVAAPDRNKP